MVENRSAPQWNGDDEGRKANATPPQRAQLGSVQALHAWFDAQVSDHGAHAEHGS